MDKTIKPQIALLDKSHDRTRFDFGSEPLNLFLKDFALSNQKTGSARTYVATMDERIVGFYSLTVGQVAHIYASERLSKGLPRHPIPVIILARLAVDQHHQGKSLGAGLLRDAILRTLQAADIAGIRAILVHAKDDQAASFYEHFGFTCFENKPLTLFYLLKDLRHMIKP